MLERALHGDQLLQVLLGCLRRCKAHLPVAAAAQCLHVLLQLGGQRMLHQVLRAGELGTWLTAPSRP